jgi:hypothetical protein
VDAARVFAHRASHVGALAILSGLTSGEFRGRHEG